MSQFLSVALRAARVAERLLLAQYGKQSSYRLKADGSPVTAADTSAEKAIIDTIKKRYPTHGFCGEETGRSRSDSEYVWIIDPVDGTKNFIDRIPLWGTLIALQYHGELILGVSNVPLMRELLWAERGKGAYLNDRRVRVSTRTSLSRSMISYGSLGAFRETGCERRLLSLAHACRRQRAFGDLWPYHLLASGRLEIVIEAKIKAVDVAPFVVIIKEAGGRCSDLLGHPFDLGIASFVATNGKLHNKVLAAFG